jgi:D-serine deaminase-like pyridoxal phosphate-dependent protein
MCASSVEEASVIRRRGDVATPALIVDRDLLESNLAAMAARVGTRATLRPHVKAHKCVEIARRQLAHGAVGLSCASWSEARVMVDHLGDASRRLSILITSPTPRALAGSLADLALECDLLVAVDCVAAVEELAVASAQRSSEVGVLCDVDVGLARTGVVSASDALAVVGAIANAGTLSFAGVQGYAGHVQHLGSRDARARAVAVSMERLASVIEALEAAGHHVAIRTGGGTGSASADLDLGVLNELQPGSYVFMDRQYADALADEPASFHQSLVVASTVVSAHHATHVTLDAGFKALATDAGPPGVVGRADATYSFFGDEFGMLAAPSSLPSRGQYVELVPPHCDPTVDRYDAMWVARGDEIIGRWAIEARGCSQ